MTTTLYLSPQPTRSHRAKWAYAEAGITYEAELIDVFKGEQKQDSYLSVNPLGQVPSALYDGIAVSESSALALIAATESKHTLIAAPGTVEWKKTLQWAIFAPAELDHFLARMNEQRLFLPPEQRSPKIKAELIEHFNQRAEKIVKTLSNREYLVGNEFSVADICVGHSIVWAKMHDMLKDFPRLESYLHTLESRKAFNEVYGGPISVFPDPHN